jgi:hypothetical protein
VKNAITSGNANLASQLANCCCQTQRSIDSVNLNLTQSRGLILLNINHTATGATEGSLVSVATSVSSS